jgi:predicted acyltransferase
MSVVATKKLVNIEAGKNAPGKKPARLQSLDALRGFDMFWIMSGEIVVHKLAAATKSPATNWMSHQLSHSTWNGFTFYDLIFPLFIFIAGVSMPYSFGSQLEKGCSKKKIYQALIKRTLILIFLGMVVNGLFKWQGYENTRFASVLGRIALACFFAAVIYLNANLKKQILWFFGLLVGYWAAMMLIPVPQFGAGNLTPEGNLSAYIDRLLLPGKLHRKVYDPEGLFSTIPAIGSAMLGVFAGQFLRWQQTKWNDAKKAAVLALAGLLLMAAGWVWNIVFPINKTMWTSSFVLYAGGWSTLFLSLFYFVIDVAGWKRWSLPLVWIGMNSILIYVASHGLIDFEATASYLFGGVIKFADVNWQPVWLAIGIVAVQTALLYFLYRKKWFLKI